MRIVIAILFFSCSVVAQQHLCPPCLVPCSWPDNQISVNGTTTDALCVDDGTVDITVTGTTPPYSYLWSNGAVSEDLTGLTDGAYTVTVTNSLGCTAIKSFTVGRNCPCTIDASAVVVNATCGQGGSITLTPTGSPAPTYLWSNGATTQNLTNVANGAYSVIMTNQFCSVSKGPYVVGNSGSISGTYIYKSDDTCGQEYGVVEALGTTGGVGNYQYSWSNGSTQRLQSSVPAGEYRVTVTSGTCTQTATATVGDNTTVATASVSGSDEVICQGEIFQIDATTGGAGRSVMWNPVTYLSATDIDDPIFSGAPPGVYDYTITARIGTTCSAVAFKRITVQSNISNGGTISGVQSICSGATPARLNDDVNPTGCSNPVTYFWQSKVGNGSWGAAIGPRNNPFYSFTATNKPTQTTSYRRIANCACGGSTKQEYSNEVTVTVNPLPTHSFTGPNTVCKNTAFSLKDTVTNTAQAPYNYKIYHSSNYTTPIADVTTTARSYTVNLSGYSSGSFRSVVTDNRGCVSLNADKVITWADSPVLTLSKASCLLSVVANTSNCTGALTYKWQHSPNGTDGWTTQSTTSNSSLAVTQDGYWRVVGTCSATGCEGYSNVIQTTFCTCDCVIIADLDANCDLGYLTSGNCASYTYEARNQYGQTLGTSFPLAVNPNIRYYVYGTSNSACANVSSNEVTTDGIESVGVIDQQGTSNCDGSIDPPLLTTSGWTNCNAWDNSWQQSINGGAFSQVGTDDTYNPPSFTSGSRSYKLCRSCASGCGAQECTPTVTYSTVARPSFTISGTTPICEGQSTTLTPSISGDYSWAWTPTLETTRTITVSQSGTYTLQATDNVTECSNTAVFVVTAKDTALNGGGLQNNTESACGSLNPGIINSSFEPSCFGRTYEWEYKTTGNWFTLFNSNVASYDPLTINQTTTYRRKVTCDCGVPKYSNEIVKTVHPAITSVNLSNNNPQICVGDSALVTATPTGGTAPYTYAWSNGKSGQSVYFNASTPFSTYLFNVTVTDVNGCSQVSPNNRYVSTKSDIVTAPFINSTGESDCVSIPQDVVVALGWSGCNTPNYKLYESVNGGAFNVIDNRPNLYNKYLNLYLPVGGITSGTKAYKVSVQCNDCREVFSNTVTYTIHDKPTLTNVVADGPLTCVDPNVQLSYSSNGTFVGWSGPFGYTSSDVSPTVTESGTYTVAVTNANGCQVTQAVNVVEDYTKPPPNTTTVSICQGQSYKWPENNITYISAANVTVTKDQCTANEVLDLTVTPLPTVSATGGTITCASPTVQLTYSSAATFVKWIGENGYESFVASPVVSVAGQYTVEVASGGCTNTATVQVVDGRQEPTPYITSINICSGSSYSWGGVSYNATGTYTINNSVCLPDSTLNLFVRELPAITAGDDVAICQGGSTTLLASCTDFTNDRCAPIMSFSWSNGANTASTTVSPASTTAYTVTVTNGFGCQATDSKTVTVNAIGTVSGITNNTHTAQRNDRHVQSYSLNSTGSISNVTYSETSQNASIVKLTNTTFEIHPVNTNAPLNFNVTVDVVWTGGCTSSHSFPVTIADGRLGWALYSSSESGTRRHWMFRDNNGAYSVLGTDNITATNDWEIGAYNGRLFSYNPPDHTIYEINKITQGKSSYLVIANKQWYGLYYTGGSFWLYSHELENPMYENINSTTGNIINQIPLGIYIARNDVWVSDGFVYGVRDLAITRLTLPNTDNPSFQLYPNPIFNPRGLVYYQGTFFLGGGGTIYYGNGSYSALNVGGDILDLTADFSETKEFIMP